MECPNKHHIHSKECPPNDFCFQNANKIVMKCPHKNHIHSDLCPPTDDCTKDIFTINFNFNNQINPKI